MNKTSSIFEALRAHLNSPSFASQFRINDFDFVRTRILSCQVLVLFILNLLRQSIANELILFTKSLSIKSVSRGAISKARLKLSPKAFVSLNEVLIKEFYKDNGVKKFQGFILAAIDGSMLELPANCPDINKRYGGATNQTDYVAPMARTSILFDVLNGVMIDSIIAPYASAEREMAFQHIENILRHKSQSNNNKEFLLLFDRGYPSVPLLAYLLKHRINFVMRCNSKFIKEVDQAAASNVKDSIIEIESQRSGAAQKLMLRLFPYLHKTAKLSVRVIIVTLKNGEKEILLTSLINKNEYPYKLFKDLYYKRWCIEENYKFQKCHLSIENFSGKSCLAVEQDFHATVLISNIYALLALDTQDEIEEGKSNRKYKYKINKNVGISLLKNDFIKVMMDSRQCLKLFILSIIIALKKHLIPIRPGRSFERKKRYPHRKFHMNLR